MATTREPYVPYSAAPARAPYGGPDTYRPGPFQDDAIDTWQQEEEPAADYEPKRRASGRNRVDEWMEKDFKFGGSRIKRKTVALILLGTPGLTPLFFMAPAYFTVNSNTIGGSVDDTLGTGAAIFLFLCLLVTPAVTLTGQHWFVPLRRWFGLMMAACGVGDAISAGFDDSFSGGFLGQVGGHVFELMGFIIVMMVIPVALTSNSWAQRKLGRYWKRLQQLTYVMWALLGLHLMFLEGFGFQSGGNGAGNAGDGDPIFHNRFYQYGACSLFLLALRLPPVKRWTAARQSEGRGWLVWVTITPIFLLFVFGMTFFVNELIFKGLDSFRETPSGE